MFSEKAKELMTMSSSYILMVATSILLSTLDLPLWLLHEVHFFACAFVAIGVLAVARVLWYVKEPEKRVSFGRALIWRGRVSFYKNYWLVLMAVTILVLGLDVFTEGVSGSYVLYRSFFIVSFTEAILVVSLVLVSMKYRYDAREYTEMLVVLLLIILLVFALGLPLILPG